MQHGLRSRRRAHEDVSLRLRLVHRHPHLLAHVAHYLHIADTLETAEHFGFTAGLPTDAAPGPLDDFDLLMREWSELTIALNGLNRSMGLEDAYPFVISPGVRDKLAFVHRTVRRGSWHVKSSE